MSDAVAILLGVMLSRDVPRLLAPDGVDRRGRERFDLPAARAAYERRRGRAR